MNSQNAAMQPHPLPLAQRMANIVPFHVMELLAKAQAMEAQGRSVIHMEIGEPDFPTAEPIIAAAEQALAGGRIRYTAAAGLPQLRQAIADYYQRCYGVALPAQRILVTPGASGALQLVAAMLVNPGQQVLMADPGYPCNRNFVHMTGGEPVGIPVGADSAYQLTPELVERYWTDRTVAVLLASPSNPTGTLVSKEALAGILAIAERHGGRVIVDEIYSGLVYGAQPATGLIVSDRLFVINSFSKYFGMTGWRLGWLVTPEGYDREAEKLIQNLFLAASTPAQHAALAAFTPEAMAIFEARRQQFQARRDFLLPALRELGFQIPITPQGAFYLYADCSRFTDDSFSFAIRLLEETGIAITPGIDFGGYQPERHVRFAYTIAMRQLQDGVIRLRRHLGA